MERSRSFVVNRTRSSPDEDVQTSNTSGSFRLSAIFIASSLIVGGIWFFQQTNIRHLQERIHQLQQDIDRVPSRNLGPTDRISLEKEQISLERDRINAQTGVYNALFQGVGAIILGGLAYNGWRFLRRTHDRFQYAEDKRITDRFAQALSYLASDKMEVRLGGIYLLERLAQDSPSEHWLTIEILTAFVRERSNQLGDRSLVVVGEKDRPRHSSNRIPTDIQAVMTILSRRDVSKDRPDRQIELRESNLRAADLNGIELWGADLWKVNLREAQLWHAKLAGAFLGRANLSEASLWQADLEGAYLWKANLEGANLSEANLEQANLEGSNLKGANLQQTNLINADLRQVVGLTRQQLSHAICDETTQLPDYLEAVSS